MSEPRNQSASGEPDTQMTVSTAQAPIDHRARQIGAGDLTSDQRAIDPELWQDKAHRIKSLEEALRYLLQAPELEDDVSLYTARVLKTARLILEATP